MPLSGCLTKCASAAGALPASHTTPNAHYLWVEHSNHQGSRAHAPASCTAACRPSSGSCAGVYSRCGLELWSPTRFSKTPCSRYALQPAKSKLKPPIESMACATFSSSLPVNPEAVMTTSVVSSDAG